MQRKLLLMLMLLLAPAVAAAGKPDTGYRDIPGGQFRSSVRFEESSATQEVADFSLMARPVSNAQFAVFLATHPQWRRDRIPAVFSSPGYLGHWAQADTAGGGVDPQAPVIHVNWYAAAAYCHAQQARLPRFIEWEYAAAADSSRHDARSDRAWRMRQVSDGTPHAPDAAADAPANAYGLYGMHGAYWEWSEDFASMLATSDSRGQADGDALRYCGASAMAFNDPGDYAVVKRFVLLSALQPGTTLGNLGFRCARSQP